MMRRQVVVLEVEYEDDVVPDTDLGHKRRPPAEWDWNALADMGGDESIEVLATGWVLAPREDATDYEIERREATR